MLKVAAERAVEEQERKEATATMEERIQINSQKVQQSKELQKEQVRSAPAAGRCLLGEVRWRLVHRRALRRAGARALLPGRLAPCPAGLPEPPALQLPHGGRARLLTRCSTLRAPLPPQTKSFQEEIMAQMRKRQQEAQRRKQLASKYRKDEEQGEEDAQEEQQQAPAPKAGDDSDEDEDKKRRAALMNRKRKRPGQQQQGTG